MPVSKPVARAVGALLILLLAAGLTTPYILLHPLTTAPAGFLPLAARMEPMLRSLVLSLFVGGVVPLAVSVLLAPTLQARTPRGGLILFALAILNLMLQMMENSHWLTMLTLSREYVRAAPSAMAGLELLGLAERAAWKWVHYSHIFMVVAWLFSLFAVLGLARMAPRALAGAGMLFCLSHFVGITLPVFAGYRMPFTMFFGAPLSVAILALAGWAMVRGLGEGAGPAEGGAGSQLRNAGGSTGSLTGPTATDAKETA